MTKTDELKLHYDYLKEAADILKKATEIRVSPALLVLIEKLYDEMGVVLDERVEVVRTEIIEKFGPEEAEKFLKQYEGVI